MTSPQAETYAAEQQAAVLAAVAVAGTTAALAGGTIVNHTVWMRFLRTIFAAVLRSRQRAAWAARNFFDLERARVTGLPQLDVPLLPDYQFEFFVNDMKPAYQMAVKQIRVVRELEKQGRPAPAPRIESTVRVAVAKTVADAGRQQMIEAVEADAEFRKESAPVKHKGLHETKKEVQKLKRKNAEDIVGWARVATGEETCPWCLMLVSRGAVYTSAENAGSLMTDTQYLNEDDEAKESGRAPRTPMKEWHIGCDCIVVPVFSKKDWSDSDNGVKELASKQLWAKASDGFEYDPEKSYRVAQLPDGTWKTDTHIPAWKAKQRYTLNRIRQAYAGKIRIEGLDPEYRRILELPY